MSGIIIVIEIEESYTSQQHYKGKISKGPEYRPIERDGIIELPNMINKEAFQYVAYHPPFTVQGRGSLSGRYLSGRPLPPVDRQTAVKILPYPKLRFRAVLIKLEQSIFGSIYK